MECTQLSDVTYTCLIKGSKGKIKVWVICRACVCLWYCLMIVTLDKLDFGLVTEILLKIMGLTSNGIMWFFICKSPQDFSCCKVIHEHINLPLMHFQHSVYSQYTFNAPSMNLYCILNIISVYP